ncbi:hypothetical protein GQ607_001741 [Colletotrichum asianum]|uniref:Uncharacterized protein n=1 Tax=Colletotrichum asianum TaxID=702518 RepID=A0A8H3WTZ3_9PEZI|nr:hypothetical protein GQ607_001741 [Colletotrichum asianum]
MPGISAGDHFGASIFPVLPPPLTDDELLALLAQAAADNAAEEAAEEAAKNLAEKPAKMKTKKRAHKGA